MFGDWLISRAAVIIMACVAWIAVGFWARFMFELLHIGWRGAGALLN